MSAETAMAVEKIVRLLKGIVSTLESLLKEEKAKQAKQ